MFKASLKAFLEDTNGATAIEYGLLVALLSIGILGALTAVGDSLSGTFNTLSDAASMPTPPADS